MKTLEEMIAVMQAAKDGAEIQSRLKFGGSWANNDGPSWDWESEEFRIAPTPKRVPLGPEDVPPGSVIRGYGWDKHLWDNVAAVVSSGVYAGVMSGRHAKLISWSTLMGGYEISRPGKPFEPCLKEVQP